MDEFDFIKLLRPLAGRGALKLLDDAALIKTTIGHEVVISNDTMVEGVHFPEGRLGAGFSGRLLRTALSDLAAKGAKPIGYMLSVAWPENTNSKWLSEFTTGLADVQALFQCPLLGGDTTRTIGPLIATATVLGEVPEGSMVLRSGARSGDDIWFTGVLGRAKTGLALVQGSLFEGSDRERHACEEAYLRPVPRFILGKMLRDYASSAADISDGILVEASHIAKASKQRLNVASDYLKDTEFGDDYEILFTSDPKHREVLRMQAKNLDLLLTRCGHVSKGEGVWVDGHAVEPKGYKHVF